MRRHTFHQALLHALVPLGLAVAGARTSEASTNYQLATPYSHFDIGCQDPCACPIWSVPLSGSFTLTAAGVDPLYSYYDLTHIDWKLDAGSSPLRVTGTGRYQVGGEFAVMHRLTLDLVVGTHAPQHFDSGLVPGGGEWPGIRIDAAVHEFVCFDSIAALEAKPATAGGGDERRAFQLRASRPNPFRDETSIPLELGVSGPVDLRIFDATGRLTRVLVSGQELPAGDRAIPWNGLRDDGRPAPPGLYLVRLAAPEGIAWQRIARIR